MYLFIFVDKPLSITGNSMTAIILLIFIGLIFAIGFLIAFIWAVRSGQYDDDYSPAVRILFDNRSDAKGEPDGLDAALKEADKDRDINHQK